MLCLDFSPVTTIPQYISTYAHYYENVRARFGLSLWTNLGANCHNASNASVSANQISAHVHMRISKHHSADGVNLVICPQICS